ncbi:hypothetical protein [Pseudomonas sichuanensis]|uniref:hypothetical protein n=1 Tax=Pseudomonas sichuanensis TaxID=2213015 RepID=UPI0021603E8E|nr:hypothetical protein [Pseudomonas sichuanensis]UVL88375.1 hypothetical protein LOY51_21800 [Pseudomonas sichuanensis]
MNIKIKLELASGQSLAGMPLELLRDGKVIGRAKVPAGGLVAFEAPAGAGPLAVRVDRSGVKAF